MPSRKRRLSRVESTRGTSGRHMRKAKMICASNLSLDGEFSAVPSRLRPQAREGDRDPALPEIAPQVARVAIQAERVKQGIAQAQQRA